ncbi:hypothetical protein FOZ60_014874 [Perkinsus olseni]|uniref:Uncharacterized protein n=1 Tax=Perkinsus olseni TaxID=32597 RepID=A0A7J6N6L4_PEROL|nr:hypothetical protein FOZ60_014874 [Perkinsus olseni]
MIGIPHFVCLIAFATSGDPSPPVTSSWPARALGAPSEPTWWPVMKGLISEQLAAEKAAGEDPVLSPSSTTSTTTPQTSATVAPTTGPENGSAATGLRGETGRSSSSGWRAAGSRGSNLWLVVVTVGAALLA